ncbi:MAG: hypothetical protein MUO82_00580 [Candidatus Thermoplasmatota archaeon]|nr:hypothetical protein [Candidatus Thermoplasmatota archaeon]
MNLKKSDKIIALVAVVILIIAAIGVILYTEKKPEVKLAVKEMFLYNVTVETNPSSLTLDNTDYTMTNKKPYTGTFEVTSDNLEGIDIYIEYKDNDRGLFFKESRKNTITVTVYDEAKTEVLTTKIIGMGNETLNIPGSKALDIGQIIAKDINDAREKLAENLSKTGLTQKYTIEVSVKYGEVRIRKKIIEKLSGDSFTIEITANHYDYQLEEVKNSNSDDGYEETIIQSGYSSISYVSTNYIGFH